MEYFMELAILFITTDKDILVKYVKEQKRAMASTHIRMVTNFKVSG